MSAVLAYSTDSARNQLRRGWDAFDRDVLRTFTDADSRSFSDVVGSLPPGLHFSVVRGSLAVLAHMGYLTQVSNAGPWELTNAGQDRLADIAAARTAA